MIYILNNNLSIEIFSINIKYFKGFKKKKRKK